MGMDMEAGTVSVDGVGPVKRTGRNDGNHHVPPRVADTKAVAVPIDILNHCCDHCHVVD